jgi:hypothetical protein
MVARNKPQHATSRGAPWACRCERADGRCGSARQGDGCSRAGSDSWRSERYDEIAPLLVCPPLADVALDAGDDLVELAVVGRPDQDQSARRSAAETGSRPAAAARVAMTRTERTGPAHATPRPAGGLPRPARPPRRCSSHGRPARVDLALRELRIRNGLRDRSIFLEICTISHTSNPGPITHGRRRTASPRNPIPGNRRIVAEIRGARDRQPPHDRQRRAAPYPRRVDCRDRNVGRCVRARALRPLLPSFRPPRDAAA